MHGILLVDKPEGMTSNGVVRIVKRIVRPSKVGHSGTLDPTASGLMVLLIGAATRALDYLDDNPKNYSLQVHLGEETDTDDRDGNVVFSAESTSVSLTRIEEVLNKYRGAIQQIPPHFSALKKGGIPLYRLARKGIFPELAPRKVEVFSLTTTKWQPPLLDLALICSKGTYARALARDIGRDLGVGGRLENLRRNTCGVFQLGDALAIHQIVDGGLSTVVKSLIRLNVALSHIPEVKASPSEMMKLMRGNPVLLPQSPFNNAVSSEVLARGLFRVISLKEDLLIMVRPKQNTAKVALHPIRIFNMT